MKAGFKPAKNAPPSLPHKEAFFCKYFHINAIIKKTFIYLYSIKLINRFGGRTQ